MSEKILVIGANGALGTDLIKVLEHSVPALHADFDICDRAAAKAFIKKAKVGTVINTAAFHRVPQCETAWEQAFRVNVMGVRNLAVICGELGIHLCHISTDYVFDGKKGAPYTETDPTSPLSIYAISKLAGEQALQAYGRDFSIVRSSGLYGEIPTRAKGGNFINAMMKLARERKVVTVVNDEVVSPTYTHDLARAIKALLASKGKGIYHISQQGATSWYEFAQVIFDYLQLPASLKPISAAEFQTQVQRPAYSILDNSRFETQTGFQMPHWNDALLRHLQQIQAKG